MHLDLQDLLNMRVDLVTDKELFPFARKSAEQDKNVFPFYFTVFSWTASLLAAFTS